MIEVIARYDLFQLWQVVFVKNYVKKYLQFIIALDEELAVQTAEEDYGTIKTLRTLIDYISKKKK